MSAYVLIPGAAHGGWAWHPVASRLCTAGHVAVPVTLPGMGPCGPRADFGLADAAAHVIDEIGRRSLRRVRLVAHSLGGATLARVAALAPERFAELVFVSAYVPVPGEAFADANPNADIARALVESSDEHTTTISLDAFATLMQTEPPEAQRVIYNLLTPTPGRYSLDPYEGPDLPSLGIPMRYIAGRDDAALVRPAAELAARLGVEAEFVPGPHEALLTHPDDVARTLMMSATS